MKFLLLVIPLSLIGCGHTPLQVQTEIVKLTPPTEFIQDTPVPSFLGNQNEDLLYWSLDLKGNLEGCNLDKKKIRDWSKGELK